MSKVFFISIKKELGDISSVTIDAAYHQLGLNTGNLLFTYAVWSQIQYSHAESGFIFDPHYVNQNFDHVVIPAANWLFEGFDFADLASLIEQLTIPVVLIGIGAQAGEDNTIPVLPKGTQRLIKAVSERSSLIGARGNFSAEVLNHYGINNIQVIGCPSLYLNHQGNLKIKKSNLKKIMLGGTRYYLTENNNDSDIAQRNIYQYAFNNNIDINYQSERPEFDYIISNRKAKINSEQLNAACRYYNCSNKHDLLEFLYTHGKIFTNIDDWIETMKRYDFYLGSRIHGVIATLLSGTPACLLYHDSRTKELAEFASIPSLPHDKAKSLSKTRIEEIFQSLDYSSFQNFIINKHPSYINFLNDNNLSHTLSSPEISDL